LVASPPPPPHPPVRWTRPRAAMHTVHLRAAKPCTHSLSCVPSNAAHTWDAHADPFPRVHLTGGHTAEVQPPTPHARASHNLHICVRSGDGTEAVWRPEGRLPPGRDCWCTGLGCGCVLYDSPCLIGPSGPFLPCVPSCPCAHGALGGIPHPGPHPRSLA
jgi:hypothetical protein